MFRNNPDGTLAVAVSGLQNTQQSQVPLAQPYMLDDLSAVQTAIATILSSLSMYSLDRKAYVDGRVEVGRMRIENIYYDTPRVENDLEYPSACITTVDRTEIDIADTNYQQLDEDTLNQYAQGTVVQKLGYARTPMQVTLWFGHKDDRAGARKTCIEMFAGELWDERPGRRVVMPYYYHRICVMNLTDVAYADDGEKAKANEYPMILSLETETELVRLVAAPGVLRSPNFAISDLDP